MRFGIKAAQTGLMLPQNGSPADFEKLVNEFDYAGLIERVADCGFHLLELGADMILFFPNCHSPGSIETLNQVKAKRHLSYTVHLPLWSVEPSTLLQPVREGSVRAVVQSICDTLPLQPERYVLHATGALAAEFSHMRHESRRRVVMRKFQDNARASLQEILRETGIPSRLLAIETIEFPFDLTFELAEELNLSMCLDTGHVLAGFPGPFELFDVLERVLPRLGEVHMHDAPWQGPERNIGYGKDHQRLGLGDLDVGKFLDRLAAAHWDGPIIFELSVADTLASLDVIRSLRPELVG
jgi:sugar phosphate isomerase/epimerase